MSDLTHHLYKDRHRHHITPSESHVQENPSRHPWSQQPQPPHHHPEVHAPPKPYNITGNSTELLEKVRVGRMSLADAWKQMSSIWQVSELKSLLQQIQFKNLMTLTCERIHIHITDTWFRKDLMASHRDVDWIVRCPFKDIVVMTLQTLSSVALFAIPLWVLCYTHMPGPTISRTCNNDDA